MRVALAFALAVGCTTEHNLLDGGTGGDGSVPPGADTDQDTILDVEEGRMERRDTDGDGTLDYLDLDADGDSIPDNIEAGDLDPTTAPIDSDEDALPDYVDLDSDNNGLPDAREGVGDFDLDGLRNFADIDDDNDFVRDRDEIAGIFEPFLDTDGDGSPNFRDPDSDNDNIFDGDEFGADTDGDGLFDQEDLDSDNDGIADIEEAGDDDLYSPPVDSDGDMIPDFRDLDSDGDGLSDTFEHEHGSNPALADSDMDGVDDLIEFGAGTDANDPTESPLTRGDFVFLVDYMQPPSPLRDTLQFRTSIQFADTYFLFDASGSMSSEQDNLAAGVTTILDNLTCMDFGTTCRTDGDCAVAQVCSLTGTCIEDPSHSSCVASPYTGTGYYGAALGSGRTYVNQLGIQGSPAATQSAIGAIPEDGGIEPLFDAVWSVLQPMDSNFVMEQGCDTLLPGRFGCVSYRDEAVRILVAFTDEGSAGSRGDTLAGAATVDTAAAALRDTSVQFIGVWSDGSSSSPGRVDLVELAQRSGSLDRTLQPLVFDASSTGMGIDTVVTGAINEIVEGVPLRVTITMDNDEGSADALQFIDYLEVNVSGGRCSAVAPLEDTDGDGRSDAFPALIPGTPVCWDVVPRENTTVPPTAEPQVFRARLTVYGDDSPLDARIVYFLIPPDIECPPGGEFCP